MALKAIHDKIEEIAEQFQELYTERDGKWELTGIEGIKTQADVDRAMTAKNHEKTERGKLKTELDEWEKMGERKDIQEKMDKYDELEAASEGKIDDEKMDELVEKRIKTRMAPVERERDGFKKERDDLLTENTDLKGEKKTRTIHDAVRKVAFPADEEAPRIRDSAIEDVLMQAERVFDVGEDGTVLTRDEVGVTPGATPADWMSEMQPKRPHWWPPSEGAGAEGGGGGGGYTNNPWHRDHWNLTEQGKVVDDKGLEAAEKMAKSVGSTIGATAPAPAKK